MIVINPFMYLLIATFISWEITIDVILNRAKLDKIFGAVREIATIVLFNGIAVIFLYVLTFGKSILTLILIIATSLISLIRLLRLHRKYLATLIGALIALIAGAIIGGYGIAPAILIYIPLRLTWRKEKGYSIRTKLQGVWNLTTQLHLCEIITAINTIVFFVALYGFLTI